MAGNKVITHRAEAARGKAHWQQDWMKKVLSNGHCSFAKLLFMRIASFGDRGCWMTNETLCEEFNRSESTIRRAITSLWSAGDLIITGWDGHGRKMYVTGDPRVRDKLNQGCKEAIATGKVQTSDQYLAKIRLRGAGSTVEN